MGESWILSYIQYDSGGISGSWWNMGSGFYQDEITGVVFHGYIVSKMGGGFHKVWISTTSTSSLLIHPTEPPWNKTLSCSPWISRMIPSVPPDTLKMKERGTTDSPTQRNLSGISYTRWRSLWWFFTERTRTESPGITLSPKPYQPSLSQPTQPHHWG